MLSNDMILLKSKPRSRGGSQVAAMIGDIGFIELGGIEPAVRALGGYAPEEKLDERCRHLVALLKILYCASKMEFPLQSIEGVKADARELMDEIERDLG
ncbi:MAG TPA: hypothetical protein VGN97_02505 [Mesorhizobium sp.]|jgi:hypothetical protein|nr:hypothetical protein [Mesorhizobium sp.]